MLRIDGGAALLWGAVKVGAKYFAQGLVKGAGIWVAKKALDYFFD